MSCFRSQKSTLIVLLVVAACATPALAGASLDIRPSTCPNLIYRNAQSVVVAALVSDVDFVVSRLDINFGSLELSRADGVGDSIKPFSFRRAGFLADVAAPADSEACSTLGVDGMRDLRLFFGQARLVRLLGLSELNGSVELCLSGQTGEGDAFNACDHVTMVGVKLRVTPDPDDDDLSPLP
jgi:hypothetical protein